ncbi:DNA repair exonuclease [Halorubrum sp. AD140]|uniref:metallophosphoesterase family protein n=1 Tax=Halorubrum sp. AD140 TaxID=3050073 RepID=UPI002ACCA889|nr:DNA repair exonuclease [Halorubrum sp. AD140]MDZ5811760.1 DNA repair exonuclease [Halorubrum sp. AD140]
MVRILHTADIHLRPDAEERHAALETVLSQADAADVDLVTIGGDLFDSDVASEQLRDSLRELFSDRSYPILTIPGNHDVDAFRRNLFFGESFTPATETPFGQFVIHDTRVTALPYTPQATDELLVGLRDREPFDGPEALLLHCSLEAPVRGGVGDEGEQRYFPVTTEELAELDFDYYLAGHYHTQHRTELSNGGTFVYPGTPASVTRKETGRRTAVLIDADAAQNVQLQTLDSFHYDTLDLRVIPGKEERVLEEIQSRVGIWNERNVAPEIRVDGFTEMDETAFRDALTAVSGDVPVENSTRTVEHIISHPLFEAVQRRLEERETLHAVQERDDYDVEHFQDDVWEETLAIFANLAAEGKLT